MSRADNPYDNAFMESCFSRFKTEHLQDGAFENLQDANTEILEYIEMYCNTKRRHSSLNYECPVNFEKNYYFYKVSFIGQLFFYSICNQVFRYSFESGEFFI